MHPRAIAIACDQGYFPGLQALINSIHVYHPELPIFVFERGFHAREFDWLARHPARIETGSISRFPYPPAGMWEAKQQVPAECITRARAVCLIDADIVLLSRIDEVFELAENGKIVAGCDGAGSYFSSDYQVYGPQVVGQRWHHLNSGLVCFDLQRHWDLIGLWAFSSSFGAYTTNKGYPLGLPGLGDQGLLDGLMALLNKHEHYHRLPLHIWHDFRAPGSLKIEEQKPNGELVVQNEFCLGQQRIAHCIGMKWWYEGADRFHPPDDKLKCFRHFGALDLSAEAVSSPSRNVEAQVNGNGQHSESTNGTLAERSAISLPAVMIIHCTAGLESQDRVQACLMAWRAHHPTMSGLMISDGAERWHVEEARRFDLEYHAGARVRKIEFGALWLARMLVLGLEVAERHGAEYLWRIHPDTLVQRPFRMPPPDADWFGHIHNNVAPHVHGGTSFLRVAAAKRLLERLSDCSEFSDRHKWLPTSLDVEVLRWAERTGWVSADFIMTSLQEELGLKTAVWNEVHSVCNMTPLPDNHRRYAVVHPVRSMVW